MATLAVASFWLLVLLPGAALSRWHDERWLQSGPLGNLALSYLGSFALFTPVSVLCYLLGLPLWVMTGAVAALVAASAVFLLRRARLTLARPGPVAALAGTLVIVDALMGLRAGSHFGGDAPYHVARVRMLLTHGFNNWDPLIAGQHFERVYHTNLYHALMASGGQLTGLAAPEVWAHSWFFAKLACAGSVFHMTWVLLDRRWLAWLSAAGFAVWMAPNSVLPYPNTLAPLWLLPLALAFTVELVSGRQVRLQALGLVAVLVVVAQVHPLYFLIAALLVGPLLVGRGALLLLRRQQGARWIFLALLGLALGATWPAVSRLHAPAPRSAQAQTPHPAPIVIETAGQAARGRDRGLIQLDGGRVMANPAPFFNPLGQRVLLFAALIVGLFGPRRRSLLLLLVPLGTVMAILLVPSLCTLLVDVIGAPWIVRRFNIVFSIASFVLFPAAALSLLAERPAKSWLPVLCLVSVGLYAHLRGVDKNPWTRSAYLAEAVSPVSVEGALDRSARRRRLFDRFVPAGATIVAPLKRAYGVAMDCNCYILAATEGRGSRGLSDMAQRRADVGLLLGKDVDRETGLAVLRHHGLRHFYVRSRTAMRLRRLYGRKRVTVEGDGTESIVTVNTAGATPR